jgi:hypothetical protein
MKSKDTKTLAKHLENYKNRLSSKIIPDRHKGKEKAYLEFLTREIKRTQKKIDEINGVVSK